MNRVLVSVHHTHGHSGVVIGDGGVLLVRNLRAAGAGWEALQGERPGVLTWPGDHLVAGGLLPGGAAGAELVVGGRRASAVVARGAWIVATHVPTRPVEVRFTGPDGAELGWATAAG